MSKLLTGILAGIAIGVLIAPDKGSETRRKLTERLSDYKDSIEDFVNNSAETIETNFNSLKNEANNFINKGKNKMDSMRGDTQDPWNA
ncbi:MAG: YtxH domain-containing protein [Chitinophagaceae bacterium]